MAMGAISTDGLLGGQGRCRRHRCFSLRRWRGPPRGLGRIDALKYVLSLGVGGAAVPLVAWLYSAEALGGNGFVAFYWVLAGAAAIVAAVSLLLPGRRELAALLRAEAAA